ncbi:hypothetical protein CCACVL1_05510 [Corchorus capsularis]|uniref:SWIB domain-containing protein n=1 Tax=Corchorus capsularis TaxID=210143 RepID=A0A1R3JK49_COCAP|nr:hypothetical protein CCACVL1_05510 [Corchorus capsularis]
MSSVFKGFKALLASPAAATPSSGMAAVKFYSASAAAAAAAKSTTSKVASKTPKKAATPKPKASKPAAPRTTGINKVTPVSPALGQFLGTQQASRTEAVKQIWTYIKSHNLQVLSLFRIYVSFICLEEVNELKGEMLISGAIVYGVRVVFGV